MDRRLLDGAVTLRALPRHAVQSLTEPVRDGRLVMPAGELAVVLNGPTIRYIAVVEFKPKTPRGNHVHQQKSQWVYLISGELEVVVKDTRTSAQATCTMRPGDLISIQPYIAHVFTASVPSLALEACTEPFQQDDTTPYPLVPTT